MIVLIGSEATLHWKTGYGTLSLIGAVICCNDEAGILMAERGWSMEDRPTGLFERIRLPEDSQRLNFSPLYARTGMFDEIDGNAGWYAGATWQMPGVVKVSVIRYDNDANPRAKTARDTAWDTRFWSLGARSDWSGVTLIAQALRGDTVNEPIGGDDPCDFTYVVDVGCALVSAAERPELRESIYNVTGGRLRLRREFADIVRQHFPQAQFNLGPGINPARHLRGPCVITRSMRDFDYRPHDLESGIGHWIARVTPGPSAD